MGRRVATIPWTSAGTGPVFALVHPGGLLAGPIKILRLGVEGAQHLELRVELARHTVKATGGIQVLTRALIGDGSNGLGIVLRALGVWPASPELVVPDRCSTRGPQVGCALASGLFWLAANQTLVVSLLDAVPTAALGQPLTFVLEYDE